MGDNSERETVLQHEPDILATPLSPQQKSVDEEMKKNNPPSPHPSSEDPQPMTLTEETSEVSTVSNSNQAVFPSFTPTVVPRVPLAPTLSTKTAISMSPNTSKRSYDEYNDDDDDDDDDSKLSPSSGPDIDPERLKAFNMFCRLFVDENLDRMVPISKQPKEKVQAILDACDRQFPEFHERARKRVRTYLKSCRRMRRAREMNGWDAQFRPTPPHLTSPIAESLLSRACENETQNAKRMRMGLEPISVGSFCKSANHPVVSQPAPKLPTPTQSLANNMLSGSLQPSSLNALLGHPSHRLFPADWSRFPHLPQFRPDLSPLLGAANGFVRPGPFPGIGNPTAAAVAAQLHCAAQQTPVQSSATQHNPRNTSPVTTASTTDKKPSVRTLMAAAKSSSLSPAELTMVKQLISGYRESATFLYRSADELEQLLSHNK